MGKAIVILEIAQCCSVEVLKLMYGSETISILGPKIWDILPTELRIIVSPKRKFVSGPQRIVHVVYVKRTEQWISLSYLYVHILFRKMNYFI